MVMLLLNILFLLKLGLIITLKPNHEFWIFLLFLRQRHFFQMVVVVLVVVVKFFFNWRLLLKLLFCWRSCCQTVFVVIFVIPIKCCFIRIYFDVISCDVNRDFFLWIFFSKKSFLVKWIRLFFFLLLFFLLTFQDESSYLFSRNLIGDISVLLCLNAATRNDTEK